MSIGIIIPFRGLRLGKTRLRARLPDRHVEALSERMLAAVLEAARRALPEAPIALIMRDRGGVSAPAGVAVLEEALDLNDAVDFARGHLEQRGVKRIIVIASDLPLLQPADIEAVLAPPADVVIAPDAAQRGTNALAFAATEARFCRFGEDSARLHAAEAAARNLAVACVHTAALCHDVDTVDQIDGAVRMACAPHRGRG